MNVNDFTYILRYPEKIGPDEIDGLDNIVAAFPYFQSARALRLKGLYDQDSFKYNFALKVTAAYTKDRSVLFDFITSDIFVAMNRDRDTQSDEPETPTGVADLPEALAENPLTDDAISHTSDAETHDILEVHTSGKNALGSGDTDLGRETPNTTPLDVTPPDPLEQSIRSSIEKASADPTTSASGNPTTSADLKPLDIGKPLHFTPNEKHSFTEWLQLASAKPIIREEPEEVAHLADDIDAERRKKLEIIDRFIEANPKIAPAKATPAPPPVLAEPSKTADHSYLMTETLARVYLEQQKYDKAIQAYEILILKYPEKSSFFADRILDIRNLKK